MDSEPMNTASEEGDDREGEGGRNDNKRFQRPAVVPTSVTNRVYVGNLPWQVSWQDLKDHFRRVGEPVHASVFLDEDGRSKGCGIVEFATREEALKSIDELNDSYIGNSNRPIFVREDREDRNAPTRGAGERGGGERGGGERAAGERGGGERRERGEYNRGGGFRRREFGGGSNSPHSGESIKGRQVFVGNLPFHTSWQDLKDAFREAGSVQRADVLTLPNGRSKGQGTVLYETAEQAQKAIELFNNTDFQGRKITVHEDKFAQ